MLRYWYMSHRHGDTQRKILLILLSGIALGLSGSPKRYFKILDLTIKEWGEINKQSLRRSINALYKEKLVSEKYNKDGTVTLFLTKEGKKFALTYDIENMKIEQPSKWDKKWRIVIFDISERLRKTRNIFRIQLRSLGFYELQKSVFVYPYKCKNEIEYLTEFYKLKRSVRFIVADSIDNELHLKQIFELK